MNALHFIRAARLTSWVAKAGGAVQLRGKQGVYRVLLAMEAYNASAIEREGSCFVIRVSLEHLNRYPSIDVLLSHSMIAGKRRLQTLVDS